VREPEEIEDQAYERVVDRVCAIDVGKASGKVCTRVPHPSRPGQRRTRVWDVEATTNAIVELGEYLAGEEIEKVTLESTSDYWRIWFYLLEAADLDVQLVPGSPGESHPRAPTERNVTVSRHSALLTHPSEVGHPRPVDEEIWLSSLELTPPSLGSLE
jgi:hypothetical protein